MHFIFLLLFLGLLFLITCIYSSAGSTTETLNSGVGIARLVIGEAAPSHTGLYLCHASNIVSSLPPVSTKLIVTRECHMTLTISSLLVTCYLYFMMMLQAKPKHRIIMI